MLDRAEVVVPAYGCPDLIRACILAQATPRVVDIAANGWGYDGAALESAITGRTVAILAVNLLGTGDDYHHLSAFTDCNPLSVIRDSAQHIPTNSDAQAGEAIVLSFGRGKPINALGGGLLMLRRGANARVDACLDAPSRKERFRDALLGSRLGSAAFNLITWPLVYGVISRVSSLGLGETRYRTPDRIAAAPQNLWRRLGPALESYFNRHDGTSTWVQALPALRTFDVAPVDDTWDSRERMLRFPLLACNRIHRDHLVEGLNRLGLGASKMYERSMDRIEGVPSEVAAQGPFPNASRLADRLFTLPTAPYVTEQAIDAIVRLARECYRLTNH